ncbi:retrovirus-related pol polyprotein from transposon TNT 1-94 [Tanacetum coccineum]
MSVYNSEHNSPIKYDQDDDVHDPVTRISKLNISDPLHLHSNDTTALTVVSIKLKGTENYQVWSCAMLLALEGKNKIGFIDGTCKRFNTDEVLGKQWDRVNAIVLGWILNSIILLFSLHELYTIQRSVQRCVQVSYTLTKWYQEPGYDKQWQKMEPLAEAKPTASKDKEVNQVARDSDDALLERFKLRSDKVRLADDKTLDIAGVGDVILKTSFGTSWTLKDVRGWSKFIQKVMALHLLHQSKDPATMIMLSKTTAGVAIEPNIQSKENGASCRGSEDVIGSTTYLIYRILYVLIGLHILEEEWRGKDTSLTRLKAAAQIKCDTAFGIQRVTRLSEAKILHLWTRFMEPENDSIVSEYGLSSEITQSPGGSSDTSEGSKNSGSFKDSRRSNEEYSEDGASSKEGGSETPQVQRSTRDSRAPVRYSPSANYFLLTENGEPESYSEALSSKESVQWKKAIIEEIVSLEKNQTCSLVRISAEKKASQRLWMFKVKEEQNGSKRYKARLVVKGFQQKRGFMQKDKVRVMCHEPMLLLKEDGSSCIRQLLKVDDMLIVGSDMAEFSKPKWVLIFVEDSWNEEPCRDVHQVGDEREVEVLRSFNWPPSELITEDGVLLERGYSQFNDVSLGYHLLKVS